MIPSPLAVIDQPAGLSTARMDSSSNMIVGTGTLSKVPAPTSPLQPDSRAPLTNLPQKPLWVVKELRGFLLIDEYACDPATYVCRLFLRF